MAAPAMPNFDVMTQSFAQFSTEFSKCRHLPAFDNSAAVIEAIDQLGQRLERRMERIEQRMDRLEGRMNRLETQMRVS
jgi:hypothetical protein